MKIIDAQIHEPAPWSDWTGESAELQNRILAELAFGWLDAVGVHGVVIFPGVEAWGAWAAETFPDRMAYVPKITPDEPDIDAAVLTARQRHAKGQLGLRAIIGYPPDGREVKRLEAGAWDPVFTACEKHQVPLFMFITRWLPHATRIATRYPGLTLIIDHVGLPQPPLDDVDDPPFKSLPAFLALAKFPNVHVKLCGLPSMSLQRYPYPDVVPHLRTIVDAYGADRLMWGSDTTRFFGRIGLHRSALPRASGAYPGKHTYAEALHFIRDSDVLSPKEKQAILGGTIRQVLGWPSGA
jgi:L-fuconolactonase